MQICKKTHDKYYLRKFKRRNPGYFNWWYTTYVYTGEFYPKVCKISRRTFSEIEGRYKHFFEYKKKLLEKHYIAAPIAFDGIVPIFPQSTPKPAKGWRGRDTRQYEDALATFHMARYAKNHGWSFREAKSTRRAGKRICHHYFYEDEIRAESIHHLGPKLWD